jgi:hypothetical protein
MGLALDSMRSLQSVASLTQRASRGILLPASVLIHVVAIKGGFESLGRVEVGR